MPHNSSHVRDPITGLCSQCENKRSRILSTGEVQRPATFDRQATSSSSSDSWDTFSQHSSRPLYGFEGQEKNTIVINVGAHGKSGQSGRSGQLHHYIQSGHSGQSGQNGQSGQYDQYGSRSGSAASASMVRIVHGMHQSSSNRHTTQVRQGGKRRSRWKCCGKTFGSGRGGGCCGNNSGGSSRGCCNKRSSVRDENGRWYYTNRRGNRIYTDSDEYDDGYDRCCGYTNFETASYGVGTWSPRPWCTVIIAIVAVLAFIGLIIGLYFGITAAIAEQTRKTNVANYIKNVKQNYVVYGVGVPCNAYNNNTAFSTVPNCNTLTTLIAPAPSNFLGTASTSIAATILGTNNALTVLMSIAISVYYSSVCCFKSLIRDTTLL